MPWKKTLKLLIQNDGRFCNRARREYWLSYFHHSCDDGRFNPLNRGWSLAGGSLIIHCGYSLWFRLLCSFQHWRKANWNGDFISGDRLGRANRFYYIMGFQHTCLSNSSLNSHECGLRLSTEISLNRETYSSIKLIKEKPYCKTFVVNSQSLNFDIFKSICFSETWRSSEVELP